jgi:hypothetical protein
MSPMGQDYPTDPTKPVPILLSAEQRKEKGSLKAVAQVEGTATDETYFCLYTEAVDGWPNMESHLPPLLGSGVQTVEALIYEGFEQVKARYFWGRFTTDDVNSGVWSNFSDPVPMLLAHGNGGGSGKPPK